MRQPYFRESGGELIKQASYDKTAQRFGVFNARQSVIPDSTLDAARAELTLLEDLLTEFHFVSATDKAAALSAVFTGPIRDLTRCVLTIHIDHAMPRHRRR